MSNEGGEKKNINLLRRGPAPSLSRIKEIKKIKSRHTPSP
jgi:hypothetical protein